MLDEGRRILKAGQGTDRLHQLHYHAAFPIHRMPALSPKTTATIHRAGDMLELLDVDDWHVFIRFDQNTDIQDEDEEAESA